jgi:hypothetical protein
MRSVIGFLFIIALLSFSFGCASVGKEFNYQNRTELVLDETTKMEALALFGEPVSTTVVNDNGEPYEVVQYLYSYGNLGGASARILVMDFKDGKLNAYVYNSGFPEDATEFNFSAAESIKKGVDTKEKIIQLLGEPTGKCRGVSVLGDYKTRCAEGTEVWSWLYTSPTDGLDASSSKTSSVFVTFDQSGIVSHVESQSNT